MKRYLVLILIIVLIGCKPREEQVKEDFYKGTQGIVMNFIRNAPPSKFYATSGSVLPIKIELRNRGATTANGKIKLTGFDTEYLSTSTKTTTPINFEVNGRSSLNPEGGYEIIDFSLTPSLPSDVDSYKPTFLVTACYNYKTIATPTVCIDPDPYTIKKKKKVCEIKDISLTSQGAPVAVTKVEEDVIPINQENIIVQFKITVKNVGGGKILSNKGDCFNPDRRDLNKVSISAELPGYTVTCNPSEIRLYNNKGIAFCKTKAIEKTKPAFLSPLIITLEYQYKQSILKSVEIINVREESTNLEKAG